MLPQILYKTSIGFYNSIAFYPLIISLILFITSPAVILLERSAFVKTLTEEYSFLFVGSYENARAILTTLIAGTISLMVFSFSMVMVVLNQASTNFSPRIIPGVISKKSHQIVLGFYIGTIIYSLILIHSLTPVSEGGELPRFGVLTGETLGVFCLTLFVFFIHSISKSIQIDNIIVSIKNNTSKKVEKFNSKGNDKPVVTDTENWLEIKSLLSGHYRSFEQKDVLKFLDKKDIHIMILHKKGDFLLEGTPFLKTNRKLDEKDATELLGFFIFHEKEYLSENYFYGFKQLSEVAVKALSPGINDPGTAVMVINQLTDLFSKLLGKREFTQITGSEGNLRVIETNWKFEDLLYRIFAPIQLYGKNDPIVISALLDAMNILLLQEKCNDENNRAIKNQIEVIIEDFNQATKNKMNRRIVNKKAEKN